ncbi:hypothetical protein M3201_04700 [Paenibacillus motobuensis]|uniref:hypothetical protein n=1 Tax=Paenibacillus TaxID=44249 RepID=UPI00203C2212|nr:MULTISPECIES: hypothetical protein [Paenibacillus]MCM3038997.1 hypothetical protein [Paenibacillus lutimineralis]MCM3646101.1 hypothetical protein [Paenibacillus motobuensis]
MSEVENITRDDLDNLQSFSCVESYILAYLKKEKINITLLYYLSYIPYKELYNDFLFKEVEYAYFKKIPRIQDVAKEHNLIEVEWNDNINLTEIFENKEWDFLLGINSDYFYAKYNFYPWRKDHYVLIRQKNQNTYYYLNDNPRDESYITTSELHQIFNGETIKYRITGDTFSLEENKILKQFYTNLAFEEKSNFIDTIDSILDDEHNIKIRDFLGVLRISRIRIERFISNFIDSNFMESYITEIKKLYTTCEYQRLRKKLDLNYIKEKIDELYIMDINIMRKVKENLGGLIS